MELSSFTTEQLEKIAEEQQQFEKRIEQKIQRLVDLETKINQLEVDVKGLKGIDYNSDSSESSSSSESFDF